MMPPGRGWARRFILVFLTRVLLGAAIGVGISMGFWLLFCWLLFCAIEGHNVIRAVQGKEGDESGTLIALAVLGSLVGLGFGTIYGLATVLKRFLPKPRNQPGECRQGLQPSSDFLRAPPGDWLSPWRRPQKGPDPSVRPADGPIQEPPEAI
jgi:hypothetical protein